MSDPKAKPDAKALPPDKAPAKPAEVKAVASAPVPVGVPPPAVHAATGPKLASVDLRVEAPTVKVGDAVMFVFATDGRHAKAAQSDPIRRSVVTHVGYDGKVSLKALLRDGDGLHGFAEDQHRVAFGDKKQPGTWHLPSKS